MKELIRLSPDIFLSSFIIRPPVNNKVNIYDDLDLEIVYGSQNNFIAAYKLLSYLIRRKKEIFHVFNLGPFYLLLLRLAGINNLVYSVRGSIYWKNRFQAILRRPAWKLACSSSYSYIANSEYSKTRFSEASGVPLQSIKVVYNPVYSDRLMTGQIEESRDAIRIIYVGRLAKSKNLYRWIDVAAFVSANSKRRCLFRIYGDGPEKEKLIAYAEEKGIDDKIEFIGFIGDITSAYINADLMLFLSENESFGNAVVECTICKTPVVAADIPSMKEIFADYPEFLIVHDENIENQVLSKLNNLESLKASAEKASKEFSKRYSFTRHIEKLKIIYGGF